MYSSISRFLESELQFDEYNQSCSIILNQTGISKLIQSAETDDLVDTFFRAMAIEKAKNFEGLDTFAESVAAEFTEDVSDVERRRYFKDFSRVEQVLKHLLYLVDKNRWDSVIENQKALAPCLRELGLIPSSGLNLNGNPDEVYHESSALKSYPYLEYIMKIYQWRNVSTHNAPALRRREIVELEVGLWYLYLYIVRLHKEKLDEVIRSAEEQLFQRTDYCRNEYEYHFCRFGQQNYFNFKWKKIDSNCEDIIDTTLNSPCKHFLLFGEAGSGKSVALSHLFCIMLKNHIANPENPVPIFIEMKSLPKDNSTILHRISAELKCETADCEKLLCKGQLVLFLDGINEIVGGVGGRTTVQVQRDYINQIASIMNRYPSTRIWMSDRAVTNFGYGVSENFHIDAYELQSISISDIESFYHCIYPQSPNWNDASISISNEITEFVNTPLKMNMLCALIKNGKEIPQNKGSFLRSYFKMIIRREYTEKATLNLTSEFVFWKILEDIAGFIIDEEEGEATSISIYRAQDVAKNVLINRSNAPSEADNCLNIAIELKILQLDEESDKIMFCSEDYLQYFYERYIKS